METAVEGWRSVVGCSLFVIGFSFLTFGAYAFDSTLVDLAYTWF